MAKVATSVRLEPETVEWATEESKRRGVSRQELLESLIEAGRSRPEPSGRVQAVRQQVPGLRPAREVQGSPKTTDAYWKMMSDRQKRLNDKGRPPEKGAV